MALEQLNILVEKLSEIRTYLVKIGPTRRKGEILKVKYSAAKKCYDNYTTLIGIIHTKLSEDEYNQETQKYIVDNKVRIESLFKDIYNLCKLQEPIPAMENKVNFDLKTATSLLPEMNDDETTTLKLIDATELYDSMLNDQGKSFLINFILKTRLSRHAKLRLCQTYNDVETLLRDMRLHLITKKSDSALQSQLQTAVQANNTIKDFGKEIEKLFADLTIAQAEGDSAKYEVLRPINERIAIKRFADGLNSQRLGTIITARNYGSLKDAIRAAEDEALSYTQPPLLSFRGRNNYYWNRGNYNPRNQYNSNRPQYNSHSRFSNTVPRGHSGNSRRPYRYQRQVNYFNDSSQESAVTPTEQNTSGKFFRP
ncbi:uncharacterized protein LOC128198350 [Bicyclus anynana]|uniref:Uncharacterized protein LOC128198350 n=1 Tax=Bicyclus anynana TaxID=110368 RepID=A0ABM3LJN4_BICAN|nr:uncharacterized protein LOC128198350 [Bicyclus anynana]